MPKEDNTDYLKDAITKAHDGVLDKNKEDNTDFLENAQKKYLNAMLDKISKKIRD